MCDTPTLMDVLTIEHDNCAAFTAKLTDVMLKSQHDLFPSFAEGMELTCA